METMSVPEEFDRRLQYEIYIMKYMSDEQRYELYKRESLCGSCKWGRIFLYNVANMRFDPLVCNGCIYDCSRPEVQSHREQIRKHVEEYETISELRSAAEANTPGLFLPDENGVRYPMYVFPEADTCCRNAKKECRWYRD
jgi:hypothetical protein